jgi:hypothetical protein
VLFLWTMIKPYRSYLRKRTIGKWYQKIQTLNQDFDQEKTLSVMNSYLGMAQHHSSYHLSRQMRKFCNNHIRSRFYFNAKGYKLLPLIRKLTARECKNLFPQGWYKGSAW